MPFKPAEFLLQDQLLSIGVLLVYYLLLLSCCFNILSLCLVFLSLISKCLGMFPLRIILHGTLCASWTWLTISFSMFRKFSTIISSKNFLIPFLFLFFFLDLCNSNVGTFDMVPEISETVLMSFHSFSFILLFRNYFHHSIFQLTDLFFCFRYSVIASF